MFLKIYIIQSRFHLESYIAHWWRVFFKYHKNRKGRLEYFRGWISLSRYCTWFLSVECLSNKKKSWNTNDGIALQFVLFQLWQNMMETIDLLLIDNTTTPQLCIEKSSLSLNHLFICRMFHKKSALIRIS